MGNIIWSQWRIRLWIFSSRGSAVRGRARIRLLRKSGKRRIEMGKRKVFVGGEFLITDVLPEDIFIPEEMTKEHQMIFQAALDFAKKEIQPNMDHIEEKDPAFARSLFRMAGELGLNGTDIPEE